MNVRVGDIIKLENNQFVAVSVAPRRAHPEAGWHAGTAARRGAAPALLLCFSVTSWSGDARGFPAWKLHLGCSI